MKTLQECKTVLKSQICTLKLIFVVVGMVVSMVFFIVLIVVVIIVFVVIVVVAVFMIFFFVVFVFVLCCLCCHLSRNVLYCHFFQNSEVLVSREG